MIPSSLHGTGQGQTLTILMYRLLTIMALLKPICILSQLISISIYSIPRATQRGVKKAFLMRRLLGSDVFVLTSVAFEQRAADLTKYLVYRGYQVKFVRDQINRARVLDREELLAPRSMATNKRIPFVVTYHPGLPNIGGILRELHPFLHYSERCKQAIKDVPMMAFRCPKSLQDYLVHAKL